MVEVSLVRINPLLIFAMSVGKKGHFSKQCFTKRKGSSAQELSFNSAFLGTVSTQMSSSWSVDITVKQQLIPLKVDTGAKVTAISD